MDKDVEKNQDEPDLKNEETTNTPAPEESQQASVDALSKTPEELAEEAAEAAKDTPIEDAHKKAKASPMKAFFKKINVYLLFFILIIIVAAAVVIVTYLNSQKTPIEASLSNQEITQDTLKQLSNADASIGDSSQTLTIQGSAIITGQTLMRNNLNVAGAIQSSGNIQAPGITISGTSNFGDTQINTLQVATNAAIQGNVTTRDLSVSGTTSFSGPVTASQLTVTRLIMSGNAELQIPNHISFTGPAPSRSINPNVLGRGGSASIDGSDTAGTVNINTGSGTSPGCFIDIRFNRAFAQQPHVIISPVNAAAGQANYYVTRSTAGFSVCTANSAAANQTFAYDYFVTQ